MPDLAVELAAVAGAQIAPGSISRWVIRNGYRFKRSARGSSRAFWNAGILERTEIRLLVMEIYNEKFRLVRSVRFARKTQTASERIRVRRLAHAFGECGTKRFTALQLSATIRAFSSRGHSRRRPEPVNTSNRRTGSKSLDLSVSAEILICRSLQGLRTSFFTPKRCRWHSAFEAQTSGTPVPKWQFHAVGTPRA